MLRKLLAISVATLHLSTATTGQTIATFSSVKPGAQTQQLVLPSTHTFQRIIKTGDALSMGGTLGTNLDFTGYIPVNNSTQGYLSISSESAPAQCAILDVSFNAVSKLWDVTKGGKVNFPFTDVGNIAAFCSGTVTPRKTVMVCEEVTSAGDGNGDGYEDLGWIIEVDPATRSVVNQDGLGGVDKIWAAGRQNHENVAPNAAETVMYWGADAPTTGYIYKFVPDVAAKYASGKLYVLQTTAALGTGTWKLIANTTKAERNAVSASSTTAGAYNFNGIEDVEIGRDGKIYFSAKASGRIYRFRDLGNSVDQLQIFVQPASFDVDGAGPFAPEPWGLGTDNLAFDNEGNLWVLQDGNLNTGDRNHIWVVGPTHTAASPKVRLFATTPAGSEPTGITFSPDNKFLFISFMHPSSANTVMQKDAAGTSVVFNTHATVVISRRENLGIWPKVSVTGSSITEGSSGIKNASFSVTLDKAFAEPVTVKYRTISNTATTADYQPRSGVITFPANSQLQTISVPVTGDVLDEVNETFHVILSEPVNSLIGTGTGTCTIIDDDAPPAIRVSDTSTTENQMLASARVSLSATSGKAVSVQFDTRNGTAIAPGDYTSQFNGMVTFAPGQKTKYVSIVVKKDNIAEATENFQLVLKLPQNGVITSSSGGRSIATINILNSAAASGALAVQRDGVQVVSNPTSGHFRVISESRVQMRVTDFSGRIIITRDINAGSPFSFGSQWPAGIYYAQFLEGSTTKTMKLIKN